MKKRIYSIENELGMYVPKTDREMKSVIITDLIEGIQKASGVANLMQFYSNGSRIYDDCSHIETALPECLSPGDVVRYDRAAERLMEQAVDYVASTYGWDCKIFKINTGTTARGRRTTFGCHENYSFSADDFKVSAPRRINVRSVYLTLRHIGRELMPFLVTRQIFTGSGYVSQPEGKARRCSYHLSQRASSMRMRMGYSTRFFRPIFSIRNEPYAAKYFRIHITSGDANMSEFQTYLKLGVTGLLLRMVEEQGYVGSLKAERPVETIRAVSQDVTLKNFLISTNQGKMTALDVQESLWSSAGDFLHEYGKTKEEERIWELWGWVIRSLKQDPMGLHCHLDWVLKKSLIDRCMQRNCVPLGHSMVNELQLRYHDISRKSGLYFLARKKLPLWKIASESGIRDAMRYPPRNTRAFARGTLIRRITAEKADETCRKVGWDFFLLKEFPRLTMKDPFDPYPGVASFKFD